MAKKRGREVLPLNKHLLEGCMHTCKPDSPRFSLTPISQRHSCTRPKID